MLELKICSNHWSNKQKKWKETVKPYYKKVIIYIYHLSKRSYILLRPSNEWMNNHFETIDEYRMSATLQIVRTSSGIQSDILVRKIQRFLLLLYAWAYIYLCILSLYCSFFHRFIWISQWVITTVSFRVAINTLQVFGPRL